MRLDLATAGIRVKVSDHALWRACERFAICTAEEIVADVAEAFFAGRATTKPGPGITSGTDPEALYCRTADDKRCYVVKPNRFTGGTEFVVLTAIRPFDVRHWASPRPEAA